MAEARVLPLCVRQALLDPSLSSRLVFTTAMQQQQQQQQQPDALGEGEVGLPDYDGTEPAGYLVQAGLRPAMAKALAMNPGEKNGGWRRGRAWKWGCMQGCKHPPRYVTSARVSAARRG